MAIPRSSRICPQLVHQRCSFANQPISNPVQRLHVQLFGALQLHKAHGWACSSFGNRFRISLIILLCLDIRPDVFRRHQPHFVPLIAQYATKVVRTTARFHRHHAWREPGGQFDHIVPVHPPTDDDLSIGVETDHATGVLAQIDPKNRDLHNTFLSLRLTRQLTPPRRGAGHPIKTGPRCCRRSRSAAAAIPAT
jgi:hypothetical protein